MRKNRELVGIVRNLLEKIDFIESLNGIENIPLTKLNLLEKAFKDHTKSIKVCAKYELVERERIEGV